VLQAAGPVAASWLLMCSSCWHRVQHPLLLLVLLAPLLLPPLPPLLEGLH